MHTYSDFIRSLGPTLVAQHGAVSLRQVRAAGYSKDAMAKFAARGVIDRVEAGVWTVHGSPATWRRRLMVSVLAAGPGAAASHRAAAVLLGVGRLDGAPVELSVPRGRSFRRPDVVVHYSSDLDASSITIIDGIPTTTPRRLAVDAGSVLRVGKYRDVLHDLRRHHGVDWPDLMHTYARFRRRGRNGCGALRKELERHYGLVGVPTTVLERVALDLITDAGLTLPVAQYEICVNDRRFIADYAYPDLRLLIEIDGPHHRDPVQQAADEVRDEILRAAGWTIYRFDQKVVYERPWELVARVRAAITDAQIPNCVAPPPHGARRGTISLRRR